MNKKQIHKIIKDTAYTRTGGHPEELKCAQYLCGQITELGLQAKIEPFDLPVSQIQEAVFLADGEPIPCKGYFCCGDAELEAPLYYLRNYDPYSLSLCRGKIVMIETYVRYWTYQDLLANGALGFITFDGNANYPDEDIDQRTLRVQIHQGNRIPGVNINAKDAVRLINKGITTAKIILKQQETMGQSHNVILDIPGEVEEYIAFTAHYDSTPLSLGSYDNMSGAIGLLALAEYFTKNRPHYSLRFLWCGSEELGLLGSKAYCAQEENLKSCVLCINLDMIGSIMGKFIGVVTGEEKLCHYIEYMAAMEGFGIQVSQDVYSSDSTPFADKGVPAVSFARIAPHNTATIHNRYDTPAVMSDSQMVEDIAFLVKFSEKMANAKMCPVAKTMPDNMKDKLDIYLNRKRDKK